MSSRTRLLGWLTALPAVVVVLGCAWSVGESMVRDGGGLWPADAISLAEAAAINNRGEVAQLVRTGHDPNRRTSVRPGILTDGSLELTPVEAAVWSRNAPVARQLLDLGVVIDPSTARRLRCLHDAHPDRDVRAWLEQLSDAPWPACGPDDTKGLR